MKRKLPLKVKKIITDVKRRLAFIYGDKLKDIVLYGSYARGDFAEGSDIDILLVLERSRKHAIERKKYFDEMWKLGLKYDTVISIQPVSEEQYKNGITPLMLNVRREGMAV